MLKKLEAAYSDDMEKVDSFIHELLKTDNVKMQEMMDWQLRTPGKRLRPLLAVIASKFGKSGIEIAPLAAVIEIIHMASLVHDDVIDHSDFRRNQPSVQKRFGQKMAVYAGDYMIFKAFRNLSRFYYEEDNKTRNRNRKLAENSIDHADACFDKIESILAGELGQHDFLYDITIGEEQYIKNISGKTAALFELSCKVGAIEAGCDTVVCDTLEKYGKWIGIAFQIRDDILDFTAFGHKDKPVFCDFANGIYTLPVIYALENPKYSQVIYKMAEKSKKNSDSSDNSVNSQRNTKTAYDILELLEESGSMRRAKETLSFYCRKAEEETKALPDNIHKENLIALAGFLRLE